MQALLHCKHYCVAIKQVGWQCKHYYMYSNACEKISNKAGIVWITFADDFNKYRLFCYL